MRKQNHNFMAQAVKNTPSASITSTDLHPQQDQHGGGELQQKSEIQRGKKQRRRHAVRSKAEMQAYLKNTLSAQ